MSAPSCPGSAPSPASTRPVEPLTLIIMATLLLCAGVFSLWPQIDIAVSRLFYDPVRGFAGNHNVAALALYRGIPMASKAIIVGLFLALLVLAFLRSPAARRRRIQVGYLLVAMALGPGLFVDVGLKDYWGRARPAKVEAFGGASTFSPALVPSNQCDGNCSFVSGHASAGFYLVSLGFLGGAAARRRWVLVGLAAGAVFGLGRISQGGHFLTDIVFSFYATWLGAWIAWLLFVRLGWLSTEGVRTPPPPQ
ncbi:phosphatase PAP2 family protein [Azoarcus olearius]|uniref:Conserved hypothetical membrane protein n=1 Tax=Azoarcus sp. (strain BH72) TaxID=418699 RepID=A1K7H5_AZOSB|nr:phosphatase PAP2 family protein [Azoarcus olearius]ANQ85327.1 hypothetical protein dqs_2296 [Azoarcus olearius]CAL94780.1 conserved hypothetical membrane protein [Azoarcus olearius]